MTVSVYFNTSGMASKLRFIDNQICTTFNGLCKKNEQRMIYENR